MNVYLVKEVQYEWVKVVKVFKSENKAEEFCKQLLKDRATWMGHIQNYVVETHPLED